MRRFFFAPRFTPAAHFQADGNGVEDLLMSSSALQHQAIGEIFTLPDSIYHHWCRVLRAKVGEQSILFDGLGGEVTVVLDTVDNKSATARMLFFSHADRTAPTFTTIAIVMSRGDRMDYAIQKATELGATVIQLLTSQHSEVRLKPAQVPKKLAHWQQVAISACEQCGLNRPPLMLSPLNVETYLAGAVGQVDEVMQPLRDSPFYQAYYKANALKLVLAVPVAQSTSAPDSQASAPDSQTISQPFQPASQPDFVSDPAPRHVLKQQCASTTQQHIEQHYQSALRLMQLPRFDILIGAEGGLSTVEYTQAYQCGFMAWPIGERILRTETAPVVALTLLNLRQY